MYRKHIDPGLPSWPPLHVDEEYCEAYIAMRVPDWVSVERAQLSVKVFVIGYAVFALFAASHLVPPMEQPAGRLMIIIIVAAVAAMVGAGLIKKGLPSALSRFVFARRLKIYIASDVIAFRSWYYENGVRIDREQNGVTLSVQPNVAKDPDAAEFIASTPPRAKGDDHRSRHHIETSMQLQFVIRGTADDDAMDVLENHRRFRTIPVASMSNDAAENFAVLISAALDLTTRKRTTVSRQAVGLDLDLAHDPRGDVA